MVILFPPAAQGMLTLTPTATALGLAGRLRRTSVIGLF
jgi:hypothetical protein